NFVMTAIDTFPMLVKFDQQGNVLWKKDYPDWDYAYLNLIEQPDSSLILLGDTTGSFFVAKSDQSGNIIWAKYFFNLYGIASNAISNCSDGGFIVTAYFDSGIPDAPHYPWLLRFDAAGDTMWTKVL